MDVVDAVLDEGLIPTIPKWCGKQLRNLIELCLSRHVPARPSFMNIITKLRSLFPPNYNGYFLEYDIPRLREMLMSKDKKTQLMAAREISEIDKERDSVCKRCAYAPIHADIPDQDMEVFVSRLSSLISSSSTQIVLHSTKAILSLLKAIPKPKIALYKELIAQQNGFERIVALASSNNAVVCESAFALLNYLTSYNQYGMQIGFDGLDAAGLGKLKDVILLEMQDLEKKKEEIERILSQKKEVLARIVGQTDLVNGGSNGVQRLAADPNASFKAARGPVRCTSTFPAPIITSIEPIEGIPKMFIDYAVDEFKAEASKIVNAKAWKLDNETQHWNSVYLVLFGGQLMVYQTPKDMPNSPIAIVYCTTLSNNPITVHICRKHGKPHCVYLFDGEFDFWFCFRSYDELRRFAAAIHPGFSGSIPGHPYHKKEVLEIKDVIDFAQSLPDHATIMERGLSRDIAAFHDNGVLHSSYMLLMDPQTGIWGPFFFILLSSGIVKVYESHESDPERPSGIIYVRNNQAPAIRLILPEAGETEVDLKNVAKAWENIGLIMEIDVADYDMCCRSKEERDMWIRNFRDEFHCEVSATTVVVTRTDILLENVATENEVQASPKMAEMKSEDIPDEPDLDDLPPTRQAALSESSNPVIRIDEFTFGFPIDDAPDLSLIPQFYSVAEISDLQPTYVLLKLSNADTWELQIAAVDQSKGKATIYDPAAAEGLELTSAVPIMELTPKAIRLGRRMGKPYCVFNKEWSMCFKSAALAVKFFTAMAREKRVEPSHVISKLAANGKSAPLSPKDLLDQAKRLPDIKKLSELFIDAMGDIFSSFSYALLRDEQIEVWTPFFLVLVEPRPGVREIRFFYSHEDKLVSPVFTIGANKVAEMSPDISSLSACCPFPEPGISEDEWNRQIMAIQADNQPVFLLFNPSSKDKWYSTLFQR
eukprot:TRINITY_DN1024_c0_g3_i1.p1 TRINITY_DN1024_c0_g3~~TRINITY_DN1024_c0_g3_i1.p1  ORF type:complete len:988 (+),score=237.69 TRINITY_DN1024_c0_g3_i1:162-2966(+)